MVAQFVYTEKVAGSSPVIPTTSSLSLIVIVNLLDMCYNGTNKGDGMKVKDLIEALQEIEDPEMLVLISKDEEGNGFKELNDIGVCPSSTEGNYNYDVHHPDDIEEMVTDGYDISHISNRVVLWP